MFSNSVVPFREGDVVQEIGQTEERRVANVDSFGWFRIQPDVQGSVNPAFWRLLRRPVQVGDRIIRPRPGATLWLVTKTPRPDLCHVQSTTGLGGTTAIFADGWIHENGVSVDWPGHNAYAPKKESATPEREPVPQVVTTDRLALELCRLLDEPFNRFVDERSEVVDGNSDDAESRLGVSYEYPGGLQRRYMVGSRAWRRDELGARTKWTRIAQSLQNELSRPL